MNERDILTEALKRTDPADQAAFLDEACAGDRALRERLHELLANLDQGPVGGDSPALAPGEISGDQGGATAPSAGAGTAGDRFQTRALPKPAMTPPPETRGPGQPVSAAGGAVTPGDLAGRDQSGSGPRSAGDAHSRSTGAVPSLTDSAIGITIAGRYTLVGVIGEGGMGSVYRADQRQPVRRQVALKLIKAGMGSPELSARFDAECQALAMMAHPNIARIHDGGVTEAGQPYFVMELVDGIPITEYCDARRLPVKDRLGIFVSVCQGVQHAHQKGIIHRDLKPSNVLVTEVDGRPTPKIIDFGVAKATGRRLTDMSFVDIGVIVGTPTYMSPEQADPTSMDIDTRTDVYALGVMLYELLAGSLPIDASGFQRGAILEMLRMVREVDPPRPSTKLSSAGGLPDIAANRGVEPAQLAKLLEDELDWVVMKALEKDRERRYDTATGLARDIERYLADEAVEARPPSRGYRLRKFLRRYRGQAIAAALVFLTLSLGVIGTSLGFLRASQKAVEASQSADSERKAKLAESDQRKAAEEANRQAFDALKSFTDELMGRLLGRKDKLTPDDKKILRSAQSQWEVFARSKGDSPEARVIRSEGSAELAILQGKLGMTAESEANDRAALALRAELASEFPDEPRYRFRLGISHLNLAGNLRGSGNGAEAEASFAQALDLFGRLVAEAPDDADSRQRLGQCHVGLANVMRDRSEWAEAEKHYRDALVIQKELSARFPQSDDYRNSETDSHWGLANTLKRAEKLAESESEYRLALDQMEQLAVDFPTETWYRQQSANLARELGVFLYDVGEQRRDGAKVVAGAELFPMAIDVLDRLAAEFPSLPVYRADVMRCHRDFGKVLGILGRRGEARRQFQAAIARGEKLVADDPKWLPYLSDLGLCYSFFANFLQDGPAPAESLGWYAQAIDTLTAAYERDRKKFLTRRALAKCHVERATTLDGLGRFAEALPDRDKAVELCTPEMRDACRCQRADTRLRAGQVAEAIAEIEELSKLESDNPGHWFNFARLYAIASQRMEARKDEFEERSMDMLEKAVAAGYRNPTRLANDVDLAPLRDRGDFKRLLGDLEKKLSPESDESSVPSGTD